MRLAILTAALGLAGGTAFAQGVAGGLPRAFAGYRQPPIACHALSAAETDCAIPALTAGRYVVEAAGTSTAQGADARQSLGIQIGAVPCGTARPANPTPWPKGPHTFKVDCAATILSDAPLVIRVVYAALHAVKDPRAPPVTVRPLPWNGVLATAMFAPQP